MDQSLKQFISPLNKAFRQYHTTIAIVIVAIIVALAVFRLYQIVTVSNETGVDGYQPTSKTSGTFDQPTIERVDNLRTSTESDAPLQFPDRQSPFVE